MEFEITDEHKCVDCWCYGDVGSVNFKDWLMEEVKSLQTKGYYIRITDNGYIVGMFFDIDCPNNCLNCNCTDDYTFGGYENNPYVIKAIDALLQEVSGDLE